MINRKFPDIQRRKTLLVIGPLPPPIGGGTVNVQLLIEELRRYHHIKTIVVNISPRQYRKSKPLLSLDALRRGIAALVAIFRYKDTCDAILTIATSTFIFTLGIGLLIEAKILKIPIYVKPLGAEVGKYIQEKNKFIHILRQRLLKAFTGIFVQTQQLQKELIQYDFQNVTYIPGYRREYDQTNINKREQNGLRLIFLSQIYREKGPYLVLNALQELAKDGFGRVTCDFYGPILEEDRTEYFELLSKTPNARYCGDVPIGEAVRILANYDVFVFPTNFLTEGHPGVIIEAMMAGLPVISTRYHAVGELVVDGVNGIVIPMDDEVSLANAVKRLAHDHHVRQKMSLESLKKSQEFKANVVIQKMMMTIFPDLELQ